MKKCPKCTHEMQDDQQFCTQCGEKLDNQPAEAATEPPAEDTTEMPEAATEPPAEAVAAEDTPEPPVEAVTETPAETVAEAPVETVAEVPAEPIAEKAGDKMPGNGKKIGLIAGVIAAVAVIGVGAAVIGKQLGGSSDPKQVVIDSFKSVYSQENSTPMEDLFGFEEMAKYSQTEKSEGSLSVKIEGSSDPLFNQLAGSGLEVVAKADVKNKKYLINYGIQYQNMDLAHLDLYLDETNFMAAIPEFSKKVFTLNYAEDLEGQIDASPFLGKEIKNSGVDLSAFGDYMDYIMSFYSDDSEDVPFDVVALWERYKTGSQAIEDLKAAMTVEEIEKANYTVDGSQQECQGYQATITKDAVISFLRTSSEFFLEDETLKRDTVEYLTQIVNYAEGLTGQSIYGFGDPEDAQAEVWEAAETGIDEFLTVMEDYMGDINFTVYVDKQGRMAAIDADTELTNEDGEVLTVNFQAELKGGTYLTQNVDCILTLTLDDNEEVSFTVAKTGSYNDEVYASDLEMTIDLVDDIYQVGYTGEYLLSDGSYHFDATFEDDTDHVSIAIEGVVPTFEKGKSIDVQADSIKVIYNEEELIELSGSYGMKPVEGQIAMLEGDTLDILAASEADWQAVYKEVMTAVFALSSKFQ